MASLKSFFVCHRNLSASFRRRRRSTGWWIINATFNSDLMCWHFGQFDKAIASDLIDLVANETQRIDQSTILCLPDIIFARIRYQNEQKKSQLYPASVCIFSRLKFAQFSSQTVINNSSFFELRWLIFVSIVCLSVLFKTFRRVGGGKEQKPFVFLWVYEKNEGEKFFNCESFHDIEQ